MTMGPGVHRLVLTSHVVVSVGWIGAVAAYLVLDVTTATSQDPQTLRAGYIAKAAITWWAILPLAYASFLTGLGMALGTKWGLFRHWWVVTSLILTAFAVLVLTVETRTIAFLAEAAYDPSTTDEDLRALPSTLLHSVLGIVVLLVIMVLNVYKPRGLTRYGWRKLRGTPRG
jgi:hypothetical protein